MLSVRLHHLKWQERLILPFLMFLIFFLPSRVFPLYIFLFSASTFIGILFLVKNISVQHIKKPVLYLWFLMLSYILSYYFFVYYWDFYVQNITGPIFFIPYFLCALMFFCLVSKNDKIYYFLCMLVSIFSLLLSLIVVLQMYDIFDINNYYYEIIAGNRGVLYLSNPGYRPLGLYGNPNEVAYTLGLSFLIVFGERRLFKSWFFFIFLIFVGYALLLTGSRTAWLSMIIGLATYFAMPRFSALKVFLFLSFLFLAFSLYIMEIFPDRFYNYNSLIERIDSVWHLAWLEVIANFPHGLGRAGVKFTVDNEYMEIFLRVGLLGLIVYLFFLISIGFLFFYKEKVAKLNPVGLSVIVFMSIYGIAISIGFTTFSQLMLFSFIFIFSRYGFFYSRLDGIHDKYSKKD